ncbi:hypothetical protein KIM372_03310 [Bombiscardovia nodaiensis]|uniref:Uncharacterized protein n=1 Tax=Bombiscardovia nodaiensis TaxID=2932181 RepID=A0ABM8B6F9_9BIFI|nr:hypothetical protein KIM372_03310 [Bombiscardovia nodaiensis]
MSAGLNRVPLYGEPVYEPGAVVDYVLNHVQPTNSYEVEIVEAARAVSCFYARFIVPSLQATVAPLQLSLFAVLNRQYEELGLMLSDFPDSWYMRFEEVSADPLSGSLRVIIRPDAHFSIEEFARIIQRIQPTLPVGFRLAPTDDFRRLQMLSVRGRDGQPTLNPEMLRQYRFLLARLQRLWNQRQ